MRTTKGGCWQCDVGFEHVVDPVNGLSTEWPIERIKKESISQFAIVNNVVHFSLPGNSPFWEEYRKARELKYVDVVELDILNGDGDYITLCFDCVRRAHILVCQHELGKSAEDILKGME